MRKGLIFMFLILSTTILYGQDTLRNETNELMSPLQQCRFPNPPENRIFDFKKQKTRIKRFMRSSGT